MGERFDDVARALASGASRRAALKAMAASAGAMVVAWLGAGRAEAGEEDPDGSCRPDGTPCRFRRQCCSRNCVDFQCKCRNEGIPCRSSAQCCSTRCEKGICRCRGLKETCSNDAECCQGKFIPQGRGRPGSNGQQQPPTIFCRDGVCRCGQEGESCTTGTDCCFGGCFKGTCATVSDREAKAGFAPVDGRQVLDRVASMPVETWHYRGEDPAVRHIGPMAQDFHAAFGVGEDDRRIAVVDGNGVALAAIQGLHAIVRDKDARLAALEQRNAALEARLEAVERAAGRLG